MIGELNSFIEIIPQKHSFYNLKRIVSSTKLKDKENAHSARTITAKITDEAYIDIQRMKKIKGDYMHNILVDLLPKGTTRDLYILLLTKGNKKNIIFDTVKAKIPFSKFYAELKNVSERSVQTALKKMLDLGLIHRLNKYQYMINPYFLVDNTISSNRIAELQHYWDRIEAGDKIKEPITWLKSEKKGDSFETEEDITGLLETVKESDKQFRELEALKKQHLSEDLQVLSDPEVKSKYQAILLKFILKNGYDKVVEQEQKLPLRVIQHFAKYLRKAFKESWNIVDDVPMLHLDRTYKPLRLLDKD